METKKELLIKEELENGFPFFIRNNLKEIITTELKEVERNEKRNRNFYSKYYNLIKGNI